VKWPCSRAPWLRPGARSVQRELKREIRDGLALARLLKPFGIQPKNIRNGVTVYKGYELEDFADAFSRYLPPAQSATPATAMKDKGLGENSPATSAPDVADKNHDKLNDNNLVADVADKAGDGGDKAVDRTHALEVLKT